MKRTKSFGLPKRFTDYLAYILETRAGISQSNKTYSIPIARKHDEYLAVAGKTGMRPAGDDKGKNYDLVYSGGLIAALALDIELRKNTSGGKGLGDFMHQMYLEFGVSGKKYKIEDVIRVANTTANADLAGFFKEYVEGMKVIPLESYLAYFRIRIRCEQTSQREQATKCPSEKDQHNGFKNKQYYRE